MSTQIVEEDYYKLNKVLNVKANKKLVAFVEQSVNKSDNKYKSHLKILDRETGEIRKFTSSDIDGLKDFNPIFSPDGDKLAFLSNRKDKVQLYMIYLNGGESIRLTKIEKGVSDPQWSPDSRNIVFSALIDLNKEINDEELSTLDSKIKKLKDEDEDKNKIDPKVLTKLVYRTGTAFYPVGLYNHLHVVNIEDQKIKRISEGDFNYTGAKWLDENHVVAIAKRKNPIETNIEAELIKFKIDTQSMGEVLCEFDKLYFAQPPEVSEDGKLMIEVEGDRETAGQNTKWALVNEDKSNSIINLHLDRSLLQLKWVSPKSMIVSVDDYGYTDLREYNIDTKEFTKLFDTDSSIEEFDVDGTSFYFTATDPMHPSALWKWTKEEGKTLVYDPNVDFVKERIIIEPEEFWLENPEGIKYQGWFFDASKIEGNEEKPPLVLSIHGGPHVMWNNAGSMWHEWQVTLSRGYSVLAMNPIGSGGYGEKFSQLITSKWGLEDARDLLRGVDHFIDRVNPDRLYTTGGSYAGFQVANLISRDHRFNAGCAQRGVYNMANFWASTDIPFFSIFEMQGEVWDNLNEVFALSPVGRAKEIKTPLLIIHSENDYRVPISQAEEFFGALKIHNKEVEFVRYPREGHELSRSGEPEHVVDRLTRMIDFFDKY
jgi:dipeptidyl aminopeptidase/acylaminoacyl peptidase